MQQEKALAFLKSGRNVFLTGSAGTGKTYILNQYIKYLQSRKIPVAITASTGIAATHMNGMTIHSWSGIGIKESLNNRQIANLKTKKYLKKQLEKSKVLIIDEISMLHKNQIDLVDKVLRSFKENEEAFGGIQVILCGDFFQLPPIGERSESSKDKFAFMSQAWLEAQFTICYLTEQFRQDDNELNEILNELRTGSITAESIQKLKGASDTSEIESPTALYTHNIDVDRINQERLDQIPGPAAHFDAETKGNQKLIETLKNSVLASEYLELKVGAKVMFIRNNPEKGFVNGTTGVVESFNDEGWPKVRIEGGRRIVAEPEEWSVQDDNSKILARLNQVPLRLAWAITVHKCQGMTLDSAVIDLSKTFELGQGYVALSRLKKLNTLKLLGINETALMVDPLALKADRRFQELSKEADFRNDSTQLEKEAPAFIRKCGGLSDAKEIKKLMNRQKSKSKSKQKDSTYDLTLGYMKQQMSLAEIAEIRGLSVGTIAAHLIKIRKDHPDENLSFYRPKSSIIKKVEEVYKRQNKSEPISLKVVYEQLDKKVKYDDIKLAIAFL